MDTAGPDLLFRNCRALTMDRGRPIAESVAVRGDRITWVGRDRDSEGLISSSRRVIDGEGRTLLPGFHDAHIHPLAYAASLSAVDCGPKAVASIDDIEGLIARRSETVPNGQWIRATGYSEFDLPEGRHPTRLDLDRAAPNHPVRLNHRSGHACVLNSLAMDLVGITNATPEPPGATIVRDLDSGAPNGVLLEIEDFLEGKIHPPPMDELAAGVQNASAALASKGVTTIQDATPSNDAARWDLLARLSSSGFLSQRVIFLVGVGRIAGFGGPVLTSDSGGPRMKVGAAKVMLTNSGGRLHPDPKELGEIVSDAHQRGWQVAIHAVEADAVAAAAGAIESVLEPDKLRRTNRRRHRIEHCSELPPPVLDQVVASGAVVTTQPGFIYESGRRYIAHTPPESQPWLYRIGALKSSHVEMGFGSDAPVIDPDPMHGIYAAITRKTEEGHSLTPVESIGLGDALKAYTLGSAFAGYADSELGAIRPGYFADLVLLDRNVESIDPAELPETRVAQTFIGGSAVWNIEDG